MANDEAYAIDKRGTLHEESQGRNDGCNEKQKDPVMGD
jgi:hypothetical protein